MSQSKAKGDYVPAEQIRRIPFHEIPNIKSVDEIRSPNLRQQDGGTMSRSMRFEAYRFERSQYKFGRSDSKSQSRATGRRGYVPIEQIRRIPFYEIPNINSVDEIRSPNLRQRDGGTMPPSKRFDESRDVLELSRGRVAYFQDTCCSCLLLTSHHCSISFTLPLSLSVSAFPSLHSLCSIPSNFPFSLLSLRRVLN
jgi:hypothetical protein